ncbi:MAG: methyltransferase domain-containing protein [Fimbriimonadaceae bacterium]|nr:methyltransferase domain-containing protein [Fimbriimonadaceae bacterium]
MFSKTAQHYDRIYAFKDYAAESARVLELLAAHGVTGGSLLDVACGTGLHLQHLAERFKVEGVDLDPGLLKVARRRLPGVPLHEGDMSAFDLGRTFDAVTCLFSAVGYLPSAESLNAALECFARHTRPGGVVMVEPWLFPGDYREGHVHALLVDEPELKICRMSSSVRDGRRVRFEFHYLVGEPTGVEHLVETHDTTLHSHEEYIAAFEGAGLKVSFDEQGLMGRGLYIGVK